MSTANNTLNILGDEIKPGESKEVDFDVAHLHTASAVNVPIIIERSKTPVTHRIVYGRRSWRRS